MTHSVEITFDCLPLRAVNRLDAPLDASEETRAKARRIAAAIETHGQHNAYYLHNARCAFQLTNSASIGQIEFAFEGVVLAEESDQKTNGADLEIRLVKETCEWLTDPVVAWFRETVKRAVVAEFDRYMQSGDLAKTSARIEELQATIESSEGFVGMYL